MINVGIAGVGFMGMIHYLAYQRSQDARVVAICSRDEKKRNGDWRGIQGNFGPPGEVMDLSGVSRYAELADMCADASVDVVDLCLPPALHAAAATQALAAGKHVLCEKPIAVTTDDAEQMVQAADAAGRQLLIGHVLPFFPEFAFALRSVQSGEFGRLLGAHFKRIIAEPTWLPDFFDPLKVGGPVVDLHIHDAHLIRVLCGMPQAVFSTGRARGEVVEFLNTQFLFEDRDLSVTASSGVVRQQGRAFTHAYEIYLEKATLLFDFAVLGGEPVVVMPPTVLSADGQVQRPELGAGDPIDGFVQEINEVARAISSGQPSQLLAGDLARDALLLCQKQTESVLTRKIVTV